MKGFQKFFKCIHIFSLWFFFRSVWASEDYFSVKSLNQFLNSLSLNFILHTSLHPTQITGFITIFQKNLSVEIQRLLHLMISPSFWSCHQFFWHFFIQTKCLWRKFLKHLIKKILYLTILKKPWILILNIEKSAIIFMHHFK